MGDGRISGSGSPPPQIDSLNDVESIDTEKTKPAPVTMDDKSIATPAPGHDAPQGKLSELMFSGLARSAALPKFTAEDFTKFQTDLKNDPNFKKLSPSMQQQISD